MRNGLLMAEDSPQALMESHNATMLEEVVLKYCLRTSENGRTSRDGATSSHGSRRRPSNCSQTEEIQMRNWSEGKMGHGGRGGVGGGRYAAQRDSQLSTAQANTFFRTSALVYKNGLVLLRSIGILCFLLSMPAAGVAVYSYCIGADPHDLGLGIINEENVNCKLGGSGKAGEMAQACTPENLSCAFINQLAATGAFILVSFPTISLQRKFVTRSELN